MNRVVLFAVLALLSGCKSEPTKSFVSSAKFGVFFGGQIEERRDIPFELDTAKQTQGFRIEFDGRLPSDSEVVWKIDMPAAAAPSKTARPKNGKPPPEAHRKSITGKATIQAGLAKFDQVVPFEPGDPLGLWNARVVVGGKVVIDRPFEVYDRAERTRSASTDGGTRNP
jgi:hypothetical protein